MLNEVAKLHKEWLAMVYSIGGDLYAEDIVQEMYLKLHKYTSYDKVMNNGKVNKFYVYLTLRSIQFTYLKDKNLIIKTPIDELYNLADESSIEEQIAFNKICKLVDKETENWHWYDKQVFDLYRFNNISFRKISEQTNISWVSLFNTVKNCKLKLKNKFQEDYNDYINKDYERI